jgi:hypothetical protein
MSTQNTNKIVVLLDQVGRTIIGELEHADEQYTTINNPAVIDVRPNGEGGLALQLLPVFFKEFLASAGTNTQWKFNNASCAICTKIDLNPNFVANYKQMFADPTAVPATPNLPSPDVIKLFDE